MWTADDPTPSSAPPPAPIFNLTDTHGFWDLDFGDLISLAAALFAGGAAIFAGLQVLHSRRVARDAQMPYVWADMRPDNGQGGILRLVVRNDGPTVATNVRVTFDPPLQGGTELLTSITDVTDRLAEGLLALPPGREMRWVLGLLHRMLRAEGLPMVYRVRIECDGPQGPVPPSEFVLDLGDYELTHAVPDGSLHELTKAIKALGERDR